MRIATLTRLLSPLSADSVDVFLSQSGTAALNLFTLPLQRSFDNIDSSTICVELASYDCCKHEVQMCRRLKWRRTDTTKDVVLPSMLPHTDLHSNRGVAGCTGKKGSCFMQ
ncbi:Hypothetical protein, putative [Bodo saltans]|uniref:Uncharacterized protein n=1 Tax=Bodo saltans TaxID=75058 RepID=A0A0S4ITW0_BODSA|nr:Hypothetical protein, putative [Bodo saltans]|eukprot:CUF15949.1 Hypothetical protein, putative [Bodo saltans]